MCAKLNADQKRWESFRKCTSQTDMDGLSFYVLYPLVNPSAYPWAFRKCTPQIDMDGLSFYVLSICTPCQVGISQGWVYPGPVAPVMLPEHYSDWCFISSFFLTLASCYGLVFPSYNLIVVLHLVHQFYHGSWQPSYKMIVNFKE